MTNKEARALVSTYKALVIRIAYKIHLPAHSFLTHEDTISIGMMALIEARHLYAPEKGASFIGFATQKIHGAIIDALRNCDWFPRHARKNAQVLHKATASLRSTLKRTPSLFEVQETLQVSDRLIRNMVSDSAAPAFVSLDTVHQNNPDGNNLTIGDAVADNVECTIEDTLHAGEVAVALRRSVAMLPQQHRAMLTLYHTHGMYMREIGTLYGVSEATVHGMLKRAAATCKTHLDNLLRDRNMCHAN